MLMQKHKPIYLEDDSHPQARVCALCEVRRSALFGALDHESLEHIHAHIASPALPMDDVLYTAGQSGDAVYTIRAGIVRFERVTESGVRRIIRLAGPGDLIGQEALLKLPYKDNAVACTPVDICRIPRAVIEQLGETATPLMRELMHRWQNALNDSANWATELTTGLALRRMLKLLEVLARYADDDGRVWQPRREELGDMLGITLETASRHISLLRKQGVIELVAPHQMVINGLALHKTLQALDD